jgi:wyosine [tRNA(Phe)-imidazoG37] synthetase (radical SAM superfamily)
VELSGLDSSGNAIIPRVDQTKTCLHLRGLVGIGQSENTSLPAHGSHPRNWRENYYVYPVISRRSRGLSIGINLNPDKACNFDCVYCQVDRAEAPRVRVVDVDRLRDELALMIGEARSGALYDDAHFADVPVEQREIRDLAFSGDGEPTTCKHFKRCVEIVAELKSQADLPATKIVLITDACYLTKPDVEAALVVMDQNNGQIWAKLDAGTEAYYQRVNRPNFRLQHVIDNITVAARIRPVVIQSLFMQLDGEGPDDAELAAFVERLTEITQAGGRIDHVQVYTVARRPAEGFVSALCNAEVDRITAVIREHSDLRAEAFYGIE